MKTKDKVPKEPSLLRQIIAIHYEQARRAKALRILKKQTWSIDFLSTLLLKSAKMLGSPLELTVISPEGIACKITAKDMQDDGKLDDTDIFNHLDDQAAVNSFISRHSTR
jgi:hypothetical protein